jgi:predicted TIM-barrel fold metal-dependent hydrolase
MSIMNRRAFLATTAALALPSSQAAGPNTVIDTHTHFYDPARPQGVPWPPKNDNVLYRTVLPKEFGEMTRPLGVTGTVVVEASPWLEDNQYILDLAAKDPVIVGTVGNLDPSQPEFEEHLARFHKNPLFRGIRVGQRGIRAGLENDRFRSSVKALAAAGLEMDAIGDPTLLADVVRLTDHVADLRIVIDHMPFDPPADPKARGTYQTALRELGKRQRVYAKVSNVPRKVGDRVPDDVNYYRPALDELWEVFGADRLIYGSNWPVSAHIAPYDVALKIVRAYFGAKGADASEKYFARNSQTAYRWVERPGNPSKA